VRRVNVVIHELRETVADAIHEMWTPVDRLWTALAT
jgi:hypothetical protein